MHLSDKEFSRMLMGDIGKLTGEEIYSGDM
jgi:hypothetical protein